MCARRTQSPPHNRTSCSLYSIGQINCTNRELPPQRRGYKGMDTSCAELKRVSSFSRAAATEQEQGDFLAIEDLLDFSNEDIGGSIESYESNDSAPASSILLSGNELKANSVSSTGSDKTLKQQQQQTLSLFEGDVGGSGALCVPCDDLAELEWLSNFVEESFSSADGAVLEGVLLHDDKVTRGGESKQAQRASSVSVLDHHRRGTHHSTSTTSSNSAGGRHLLLSPDHIYHSRPGRARSKRPRSAVCFWNTRILSITDDCNILEASSTSKLTSQHQSSSSSDSEGTLTLGYDDSDDFFLSPSKKASSPSKMSKSAIKAAAGAHAAKGGQHAAAAGDRRCLHCGSQRTPQWRAGPMGPKTLCNACGVRYKSGRLLPEYRPAASPTFVESIHSNSHRRVLEMRRQRGDTVFTSGHVDQLGVC